jgi:hypothetical protein
MRVGVQRHAPASFTPGKEPRYGGCVDPRAGLDVLEKKSHGAAGIQTPDRLRHTASSTVVFFFLLLLFFFLDSTTHQSGLSPP